MLAAAFAAGIAVGLGRGEPGAWWWCAASAVSGLGAMALRRWGAVGVLLPLAAATLCLGAAWAIIRSAHVAPDDLTPWIDDDPALLTMSGTALEPPRAASRGRGSMAAFDHRPPATLFRMHVDRLEGRGGAHVRVDARVYVRVAGALGPFEAGRRVRVAGFLHRPRPPDNPGAFDFRAAVRLRGYAGLVAVPGPELVTVSRRAPHGIRWTIVNARYRLRVAARERLRRGMSASAPVAALLGALLLGDRDTEAMDELSRRFRHVGLAHLLAISGLHLGVVVGAVLLGVRAVSGSRKGHALLLVAVVFAYLMLVELRMPVLRAALMVIFAAMGQLSSRRLRTDGLVALSAIVLLAWRPGEIASAGFQLSYGVVLGIIHLAPVVRRRWFGPPDLLAPSVGRMVVEWTRTTVAVAFTAWAVATPIVIHHFGLVSPLAVGLSVVALPALGALLAIGYLKIATAGVAAWPSDLLAAALSRGADAMITVVTMIESLPGSHLRVPFAPASWSVAALLWIVVALGASAPRRGLRRLRAGAGAALVVWLAWPALPLRPAPAMTIDMLSVGDGSCFVLRCDGATVVFDAGSASDAAAGGRLIVPALHRLGVRSVDAMVVSHANLDHYSAVPEILDAFPVGTVVVTPHFLQRGRADPNGATAFLLREIVRRGAHLRVHAAGEGCRFGAARWTWLHPPPDRAFEHVNDTSTVIRIEAGGRRILLTGDVEAPAIAQLLATAVDLEADVMEMPHHGSFSTAAAALIARVDPAVVMQSTGRRRWRSDRWQEALGGRERLVTARDGACTVTIGGDGSIRTERFLGK
jgi:competence protein ComEC